MIKLFSELAIGQAFITPCGTPYVKKSSRTAWVGVGHPARNTEHNATQKWFYFGQKEWVKE